MKRNMLHRLVAMAAAGTMLMSVACKVETQRTYRPVPLGDLFNS